MLMRVCVYLNELLLYLSLCLFIFTVIFSVMSLGQKSYSTPSCFSPCEIFFMIHMKEFHKRKDEQERNMFLTFQ